MEQLQKFERADNVTHIAPMSWNIRNGRDPGLSGWPSTTLPSEQSTVLAEYFQIMLRRRWTIMLFALAGGLAGFALIVGSLPVYRARTSLDIQNLNSDFMNMRAVAPTGQGGEASSEAYIQTQIKLLQSDALLKRTVDRLKADSSLESGERGDLLSVAQRTLHLGADTPVSKDDLLTYASKHIKVKPLGLTRLVEITCDSWNPKVSSQFCNTLVSEFAEQDREIRWNEAQKTNEWLTRQVADVRDKVKQSEQKLEDATGGDGFASTQEDNTVSEQKLREIQSELIKAQSDRVAKQAQFELTQSASTESLPNVLDNSTLREYQLRLADLRRQVAELVPPLTEDHPKVVHLRSQLREVEATMEKERTNVVSRIKNEYVSAQNRENLLTASYHGQERRVSAELGKAARFNLMRKEVESGQALYQTLLQRVKEAGFASAMQISTIRVVDAAAVPLLPISPQTSRSILVCSLLGCLIGVGFSFFRERTQEFLRTPGEVSRYLQLRELGVIPSAKLIRKGSRGYVSPSRKQPDLITASDAVLEPKISLRNEGRLELTTWTSRNSVIAEAYRNATYSILLASRDGDASKIYVVSSPSVAEGKTTIVTNLAIALAQANRRVVLVDGDLRRPRIHNIMNVSNQIGVRNFLRGDIDAHFCPKDSLYQTTQIPNLCVVPSGSGTEEASGLLHSPNLQKFLARLAREFDVVLVDSPPMLHIADARILAGHARGAILVFRARSTARESAATARDLFELDNVPVIGTILNDFDPQKEGKAKYYESYYMYEGAAAAEEESKLA